MRGTYTHTHAVNKNLVTQYTGEPLLLANATPRTKGIARTW